MKIGCAVVVVQMQVHKPRREALQPLPHGDFGHGVGVAHVQTQPQPGIVHRVGQIHQRRGIVVQHVFHANGDLRADCSTNQTG